MADSIIVGPARVDSVSDHGDDHLVVLVESLYSTLHVAAVVLALRESLLDDLTSASERISRPDGCLPSELVNAERTEEGSLLVTPLDAQTHRDGGGVPAGRDQFAEDRLLCGRFVYVKRLWVSVLLSRL